VCEIVPPERLVLTYYWADANGNQTRPETSLTILLDDLGGKTKLTLHQAVFESTTVRDAHNGGWSSSIDWPITWRRSDLVACAAWIGYFAA
jgi:uncharacterized protein YndB with AHSA1/START domain